MTSYRVTVEYTVDIVDESGLTAAATEAWAARADPARYVRFDDDGTVSHTPPEDPAEVTLSPRAAISLLLGQAQYPTIPGLQFTSRGITAEAYQPPNALTSGPPALSGMGGSAGDGDIRGAGALAADRGPQPVLTGQQVVLRPWTAGDADAVFTACQDPEIQRWTTVPSPYTRADAAGYVTDAAPDAWRSGGAVFAVVDARTGQVVGSIGAHELVDGVAEVGYWTTPAARGRGLTSDALRTVTRWLLGEGGAARVELMVEPGNAGSIRVAEAAMFTVEGMLRQRALQRGRRIDVLMYARVATDLDQPGR